MDTKQMSLSDRMKAYYEQPYDIKLPMRTPVIIRLDGNAFHTLTRGMEKPFDWQFARALYLTAIHLCKNIQGTQMAYVQSDEISLLLHNYKRLESQAWFSNRLQKMTSISASLASVHFSQKIRETAHFDARAFVLPEAEVCNYFIWRQQDAIRNSILGLAQKHFGHKEIQQKSCKELLVMLEEKGFIWEKLPASQKRGTAIKKTEIEWRIEDTTPIFSEDRSYIEKHLEVEPES